MNRNVLILYSHADETWKKKVEKHIHVLIKAGHDLDIDLWNEPRIDTAKNWYPEFESSLDLAGLIILLASKRFFASRLMQSEKVRKRFKEKQEGGFPIFIILINKCEWKRFPWMKELPILPGNGKLLSDLSSTVVEDTLAALAELIAKKLKLESHITEGILAYLQLNEVGPVKQLSFEPNRRLNIITGDNSFGKTFLLECAWWTLSGMEPRNWVNPRKDAAKDDVKIDFQLMAKSGSKGRIESISFDWDEQQWPKIDDTMSSSGLGIYARFDGSFAVWDPVKGKKKPPIGYTKPSSPLFFDRTDINDGIKEEIDGKEDRVLFNGLFTDWINWQRKPGSPFDLLKKILKVLSTSSQEPLKPAEPIRIPGDVREMPSLIYPYATVPFFHWASSVQRIISLAYLMAWTWEEHKIACTESRKATYKNMIVLIDEVESHLHPQWQRSIIPSLLEIKKYLDDELDIQFLITTHSPLVLTSIEPFFEEGNDKLFHLDIDNNEIALEEQVLLRHGRVDNWLTSETFGLLQARSLAQEQAIQDAINLQQKEKPTQEEVKEVHNRLVRLLGDFDTFWSRWTFFAEQHGVEI
jgi:predicted ATPase